ncbi:MAG: hypothetical protein KDJ16_16995, partial [Hyphomicrobiales bacterium]|nr:hypothetical protein [Hyphomicrobiales bacterium]
IARAMEDVLARAVSLTVATAIAALSGEIGGGGEMRPVVRRQRGFLGAYLSAALPRLVREVRRRRKYRPAHWRVGYRRALAAAVGRTGDLTGPEWSVVPDNGERFYADPFPFVADSKAYIFVEDYSHAEGKACISVIAIDETGAPGKPVPVIEEAHHLSYPQVFEMAGEIWMLPESSSAEELVLYKAERFPYDWKRHATLISGRALSDATLLQHDGALWLFATDADGAGSTSDLMVVYRADRLEGPWLPHPANPIVIDRGRARPGGGFIREHGRLFLPVQNGTEGYGGGLGLSELLRLDETAEEFSRPIPIVNNSNWPYPRINTYNRIGSFEVIDGIAEVPR